jgi:hypothetical protein
MAKGEIQKRKKDRFLDQKVLYEVCKLLSPPLGILKHQVIGRKTLCSLPKCYVKINEIASFFDYSPPHIAKILHKWVKKEKILELVVLPDPEYIYLPDPNKKEDCLKMIENAKELWD